MSWEIINQILGLATLDKEFACKLLRNPLGAIRECGYSLSSEEERAFSESSARDLYELNRYLRQTLKKSIPDVET